MISFLTLKAHQIEATADVFRALGLAFIEEQHGAGPVHLASVNSDLVIEIYPAQAPKSDGILIGIEVDDLAQCETRCRQIGVQIIKVPEVVGGALRMIVETPEGAQIFVHQKQAD